MKQSYFQTPRTSDECTWHSWGDPIHHDGRQRPMPGDGIVYIAGAIAALLFIALILGVAA